MTTTVMRVSDTTHGILVRLAAKTGKSQGQLIEEALDLLDPRRCTGRPDCPCPKCGGTVSREGEIREFLQRVADRLRLAWFDGASGASLMPAVDRAASDLENLILSLTAARVASSAQPEERAK